MSKSITLELPERIENALVDATREEGMSQAEIGVVELANYLFVRRFHRLR